MFLLENAIDRGTVLKEVKRQKLSIVKIDIGTHDGIENYDGPKLDKLYEFDLANRKIDPNPKKLMQVQRFAGDEKKTIRLDVTDAHELRSSSSTTLMRDCIPIPPN
jgi:hypothetical protein